MSCLAPEDRVHSRVNRMVEEQKLTTMRLDHEEA